MYSSPKKQSISGYAFFNFLSTYHLNIFLGYFQNNAYTINKIYCLQFEKLIEKKKLDVIFSKNAC